MYAAKYSENNHCNPVVRILNPYIFAADYKSATTGGTDCNSLYIFAADCKSTATGLVLMHSADGNPVDAVDVVHVLVARIEVEAMRTVRFVLVKRRGPVESVVACVEEYRAGVPAGGGQED